MSRTVIKHGRLIDGTGAPGRTADLLVAEGVIVDIGADLHGDDVLDATDCVVAPGFIDVHTHYDAQVFWDPALTPSSWHGVTTVIAGNCGFSIAPLRGRDRDTMVETLMVVEDMDAETLRAGVAWDAFETFAEYLGAVEARGVRLNFGGYVGHTAVRLYVMGQDAFDRAATPEELARMQAIVGEALSAGAIGFSSSSARSHRGAGGRPVPSRRADIHELVALVGPLAEQQRGVVSLLAGERIGYDDVFTVQRSADRPLTWTPMLVMQGFDHQLLLQHNHDARAAGQNVWAQTACRPIVFQENLANPFTLHRFPGFAELAGCTKQERCEAYRDPAWRSRAEAGILADNRGVDWPAMTVAESEAHPDLVGRKVVGIAGELGVSPFEAMIDIALSDDLSTRFNVAVANADVGQVAALLQSEGVLIGLADSGAHLGQLCDACFATDLLATWVRERGVLSLEQAVHKLTGEPASFLGLVNRGVLAQGNAADVCVFDPGTVAPGPLRRVRDFPAGGERLVADRPVGVRHVLVNGTVIRRDERDVDPAARPGQIVQSGTAGRILADSSER